MPDPLGLGPDYARLWTASTVSNLGDGVSQIALPLLAATETADPLLISVVAFAGQLPWLLVSLPAGAVIDRVDRRRLMATVDIVRMALMALLALAAWGGWAGIALIATVAFLLGTGETLYANAVQPLIPAVVRGRGDLVRANSRLYAGEIVADGFAGRPLGGLLFAAAAGLPFALDSASFGVSAALLLALTGTYRPERGAATSPGTLRHEIAEGLRWLWAHRLLRGLAGLLGLLNLMNSMAFAVFVLFALQILDLGEAGFGLLLVFGALGGLLGSVVAGRLARGLGPGPVLVGAMAGEAASYLGIGLSSSRYAVALLLVLNGLVAVVWNVITITLRQEIIPDRLLGRVTSAYRLVGVGVAPIGALLGGALADAIDLRAPLVIAGVVCALGAVASLGISTTRSIEAAREGAGEA
jgi:MFS family permease